MKELVWLIKKYNDRKTAIISVYEDAKKTDNKTIVHLCKIDILSLSEIIVDLEKVYKLLCST